MRNICLLLSVCVFLGCAFVTTKAEQSLTKLLEGIPPKEMPAPAGFNITPYVAHEIVWDSKKLSLKHVWACYADSRYYYFTDTFFGTSKSRAYKVGVRVDGVSGLIIPRKEE